MSEYSNIIRIIDDTSDKAYELLGSSNKSFTSVKLMGLICDYIRDLDIGLHCSINEQDIYKYTCILSIYSHYMDKRWSFLVVRPKDLTLKTIGLIPAFVNNEDEEVTEIVAMNALHLKYIDKIISEHLMYIERDYIAYRMNYETNSVDLIAKTNIPPNTYVADLSTIPFSISRLPTTYYGSNLNLRDNKIYSQERIEAGSKLQLDNGQVINISEVLTLNAEKDDDFIPSAILEPVDKEDVVVTKDINKEICDILDKHSFDNIYCSADWHLFELDNKTGKAKRNVDAGKYLLNQINMVKANDIFIYLGDLADDEITGDSEAAIEMRKTLHMLKGKVKILVLGNNDLMDDDYYYSCGFDYVVKQIRYKNIRFTHHPFDTPKGIINIHGHIHGYKDYKNCSLKGHIDVYPKRYNNAPASLNTLLKGINDYEKEVRNTLKVNVNPDDERIEELPVSEAAFVRFCKAVHMLGNKYTKVIDSNGEESLAEAVGFAHYENNLIINREYARGDEFSNHDNNNWYRFYLKAPMGAPDSPWYYVKSARVVDTADVPDEYIDRLERQLDNAVDADSGYLDKAETIGSILTTDKLRNYFEETTVVLDENMLQTYLNESNSVETDDAGHFIKYGLYDSESAIQNNDKLNEDVVIKFPEGEYSAIIARLNDGKICYTTRVSNDFGKFRLGRKYKTPWGQTVVIKNVEKYLRVVDHPFYKELTPKQRIGIHKYSERVDKPYELIGFQLIHEGNTYNFDSELFNYEFRFPFISEDNKVPVYVILTDSKTFMGKLIRKYQNVPYNHASISFDESMMKMYSFTSAGFIAESFNSSYKNAQARYSIYVTFINKDIVDTVVEQLKKMETNASKLKYNIKGLFGVILNKPVKSDVGYFCSEFVAVILKLLGVKGKKDSALTTPYDFVQYKKALRHVQKGFIKNFDSGKLLEHTKIVYNQMHNTPFVETGRMTVKFDEDGVILRLKTSDSFMEEYDKAHKLLIEYEKSGNIEGMKHELAKLFYIMVIADTRYIHGHGLIKRLLPAQVEYAKKSKAFAMNDFKKYLQVVIKTEPNFDFTEYYKYTVYGDESIKIDKNLIGLVKKILF